MHFPYLLYFQGAATSPSVDMLLDFARVAGQCKRYCPCLGLEWWSFGSSILVLVVKFKLVVIKLENLRVQVTSS